MYILFLQASPLSWTYHCLSEKKTSCNCTPVCQKAIKSLTRIPLLAYPRKEGFFLIDSYAFKIISLKYGPKLRIKKISAIITEKLGGAERNYTDT